MSGNEKSGKLFKSLRTLGDFGTIEFIAQIQHQYGSVANNASQLPPIVQDGNEVYIDFSNFSGRIRVRGVSSQHHQNRQEQSGQNASEQSVFSLLDHQDDGNNKVMMNDRATVVTETPSSLNTLHEEDEFALDPVGSSIEEGEFRASSRPEMPRSNTLTFSGLESFSPLHELLASPVVTFKAVEDYVTKSQAMLTLPDSRGRLPLHILGCNRELLGNPQGRLVATRCAQCLMEVNPDAITAVDHDGLVPFTYLIKKWVEWTFIQAQPSDKKKDATTSFLHGLAIPFTSSRKAAEESDAAIANVSSATSMRVSVKRFPPAEITESVEWCFAMLSAAMDHLGGKPFTVNATQARPRLSYGKQRSDREALATNLASIPNILKAILLLESTMMRKLILESSVVRRVLFCPPILGLWLTNMLRHSKGKVVIDYLILISKVTVEDYAGEFRTPLAKDEEQYQAAKLNMFKTMEALDGLIPCLAVLNTAETERAVSTPIIWYIMNQSLTRTLTVGLAIADLGLHTTLMLAFRESVLTLPTRGADPAWPWISSRGTIFFIAVHYVIRRVCEGIALSRISKSLLKHFLLDVWNIMDMMAIIMTLAVVAESSDIKRHERTNLNAIILGLLWLRLIAFFKVVNEPMATFILALTQIIKDIRYFLVVMVAVLFTFGDMFHVVYTNDNDIDCEADDLSDPAGDYCQSSSRDSYMRTYALLLGDFEFNDYRDSPMVIVLWMLFTVFGVIIMLNVLIAVIGDSYNRSKEGSLLLFRRARVEYISGHKALESFLRPQTSSDPETARKRSFIAVLGNFIIRWCIFLSFYTTAVWSSLYLIEKMLTFRIGNSSLILLIVLAVICLAIIAGFWVVLLFGLGTLLSGLFGNHPGTERLVEAIDSASDGVTRVAAAGLFGINFRDSERGLEVVSLDPEGGDEILAKLDMLEKTLSEVVLMSQTALMDQNLLAERRTREHEEKMIGDLKSELENSLHYSPQEKNSAL